MWHTGSMIARSSSPAIGRDEVVILSNGVRGRIRLRVPGLRNNPALAFVLQDRLAADERVKRVRPSAVTGNVLVLFDSRRLGVEELRRSVSIETTAHRRRRPRPADDGT